ncbi:conserved hypothetical protein [Histoplasma capsulatum H143]|uniref:Tse2 ADP-ribosyltransferase toxin domain-containing protein n=1 Tax=Ajellomyces capsulatus (strain H143) TaxID=544712 RepID=C6HJI9_AJECH|nr:conserved hypothetical protein [Histoplasma capsulatum H143]
MALTNRFIRSFTRFPCQIFRLNFGLAVRLRPHVDPAMPPHGPFDLLMEDGKVIPRALRPATFVHGQYVLGSIDDVCAARQSGQRINEGAGIGTQLPEHLILVHEFRDHFSLQARMEMTVEDLNAHITHFLTMQGDCLTRDQWLHRYPQATYFWK